MTQSETISGHGRTAGHLKRRLVVELAGGLGNQMFQYAAGRALALRNEAELVLDAWSGFVRDHEYRRHYELGAFPIVANIARPWLRLPFWLARVSQKIAPVTPCPVSRHWYGELLIDTHRQFLPEIETFTIRRSAWMSGYWQTAQYFRNFEHEIQGELMPPAPFDPRFRHLGDMMRRDNSVALGVRLYEESKNPAAHAADGMLKSADAINGAISRLAAQQGNLHFYIFCTHRSPLLGQLRIPGSITYITHDDGYVGAIERLWLLTQCRHHIFTNSTFYWWGAWLSRDGSRGKSAVVFAADNFKNRDSVPVDWHSF